MSSESLALKYRPHNFENIVGQKAVSLILSQMVLKDVVPNALLLVGDRGTGKTSCARVLAAALNCDIQPGPCGSCSSCIAVFNGTSLAVSEIDAASHGLVMDIRALRETVLFSVHGNKRVIILDEVQLMSREAFNALLKLLEEPPSNTIFVLITTEPGKIPATILSRCMEFAFNRIPVKDIVERLQFVCDSEGLVVDPALLTEVAEYSSGGLRDAVMTLDQVTRVGVRSAEDFADLFGVTDYTPQLFSSILSGDIPGIFSCIKDRIERTGDPQSVMSDLVGLLSDLLLLKSGGRVSRQGAALEIRQGLSRQVEAERLVGALKVLWAIRTEVRAGDPEADLRLALVMMSEAMNKEKPRRVSSSAEQRLTLSDMQLMAAGS